MEMDVYQLLQNPKMKDRLWDFLDKLDEIKEVSFNYWTSRDLIYFHKWPKC